MSAPVGPPGETATPWRDRLHRLRSGLVRLPRLVRREPLPAVTLRTGRRTVPVALARLGPVLLGVVATWPFRGSVIALVLLLAALVMTYVRPAGIGGLVFVVLLGFFWIVLPTGPGDPWTYLLIGLGAAVPALAVALGPVSIAGRIEPVALLPALRRYALLQLLTQPVVAALLLVQTARLEVLPLALLGAVAVAVAGWLLVPRLVRDP